MQLKKKLKKNPETYKQGSTTEVSAPDFLDFQDCKNSGMERYPSPKLASEIHFYYYKNRI